MRKLVMVVGLLVPMAALAELGRDPAPSSVVYPPQQLPLSFSHARHAERGAGECTLCHAKAKTSTRASDDLMPAEAACTPCHAIDRAQPRKAVAKGEPPAACGSCHAGWDGKGAPPRVVVPAPNLKFAHQLHAAVACATCHGDLRSVGLATRLDLPRMATCMGCHDGKTAQAKCVTCHPGDASGRMRTAFPEGQLVPTGAQRGDTHDLRFRTDHARVARSEAKYCESCHTQAFCVECHDGKLKPLDLHAADYQNSHAADARRNTPDCQSCHRLQTFCTGCHARSGVMADKRTGEFAASRLAEPDAPRFHKPGFQTGNAPGERMSDHHAFQAQRNLRSCVSCHREDFCMSCHTAQPGAAAQISPHPRGWRGSRKCAALVEKNERVCLRCHVEGRTCDD